MPLLLFTLACILLGTWLARSGLRPRRTGNTPHCGECGYALVAIETNTCPECGTDLVLPDAIVRGERIIKWRRAGMGIVLMAVAVGCLITAFVRGAADIDWYEYRPFNWVLRDLDGSAEVAKQSVEEIQRRFNARELSVGQTSTLVERLLKEQASTKTPPHSQLAAMMQLLETILVKEKMSPDQRQRFLMAATEAKLVVVPAPIDGDPPLIRLICEGNASGSNARFARTSIFGKLEWDGVRKPAADGAAITNYLGVPKRETIPLPDLKPGKHHLSIAFVTTVDCKPVFRRKQDLSVEFETPAPPPPITWIEPAFPRLARLSFEPGPFTATSNGTTSSIHGSVTVTRPGANVAMDVYAHIGRNLIPLGLLHVPQGKTAKAELEAIDLAFPLYGSFDMELYFYSSEKAARAGKPAFKDAWTDKFARRVHVERTAGATR